jgi:hypothetical protein
MKKSSCENLRKYVSPLTLEMICLALVSKKRMASPLWRRLWMEGSLIKLECRKDGGWVSLSIYLSLSLSPYIRPSFSFSNYENYSILTEPNLTKSYMTQVCRVGSKDVVSLRSMEDALRYYRDLPSACDWPAGSESEALHSSKRPIKVT